jgi:hypothetical protein
MLQRRRTAHLAIAHVPDHASVSADTPLLPLLAQREKLIRFPNSVEFLDRDGLEKSVDYVVAFPEFYTPLASVFESEGRQKGRIIAHVNELISSGRYQLIHCQGGALVLSRVSLATSGQQLESNDSIYCDILN